MKISKTSQNKTANPLGILAATPDCPDYCSPGARAEWGRVAPFAVALGSYAGTDERALALCCESLGQESILREVLGREGYTIETGAGGSKARPAAKQLSDAQARSATLLASFGLTPKSRKDMHLRAPGQPPFWKMTAEDMG